MSNFTQQEIATSDTQKKIVRSRTVRFGTTRWLTYTALFTALALLMKGFGQIGTLSEMSKITVIYTIWLVSAIVIGPIGSGVVCFISDFLIALMFPTGTFNPFITLVCTLYGILAGLIIKYLPSRLYAVRVIVAGFVCAVLCTFVLNTYAIWGWCKYYLKLSSYIDGRNSAFGVYLSARTFQLGVAILNIFITVALIPLLSRMSLLPPISKKENKSKSEEINMPNISVKMLAGRTQAQKEKLAKDLVEVLSRDLGADKHWITCTIEDYDAEEWQEVFKTEIADKPDEVVFKKPEYDPKILL